MTTKEAFLKLCRENKELPGHSNQTIRAWRKRAKEGRLSTDLMESVLESNGYVKVPEKWKKSKKPS